MTRVALVSLLLCFSVEAAPRNRLGALIATYLAEEASVTRREQLLAEIRRVTGDDPARVAAAIRRGDHHDYARRPALKSDGASPVFRGRNFRCRECDRVIAGSAGRYAQLILPPGYDPAKRYPLLVDIGARPRKAENDAVIVVVNPAKHVQANSEAVALERLVVGVTQHVMQIAAIDSDRVFLRGGGSYSEMVWYIAFQNPDRFAGIFCGPNYWTLAALQAKHARQFSIFTTIKPGGNLRTDRFLGEFRRFTTTLRVASHPRPGTPGVEALARARALWQQTTMRPPAPRRIDLVCVRPFAMRCRWVRLVPKTRSRREATIAKRWKSRLLAQPKLRPAKLRAWFDAKEANLVHVETEEVVAFQIYVDPALVDLNTPVLRIRVNGGAPVARLLEPDIAELLDDYRERRDPKLLSVQRISFP